MAVNCRFAQSPLLFPLTFFSSKPTNQKNKNEQDVSIPIDNASGSHRGFGFVEFEEEADANAAALNMDAAEFFGRTLRVNQSQSKIGGGGNKRDAIWADGDAWNERGEAENAAAGGGGIGLDASAAFKRQVGGAETAREQPPSSVAAANDPMAAAEAALG